MKLYRFNITNTYIQLSEFTVVKETPKGYWLFAVGLTGRFVLNYGMKRYAYPTIEEARTSFIARKRRQKQILTAQLRNAAKALEIAESTPAADLANQSLVEVVNFTFE